MPRRLLVGGIGLGLFCSPSNPTKGLQNVQMILLIYGTCILNRNFVDISTSYFTKII